MSERPHLSHCRRTIRLAVLFAVLAAAASSAFAQLVAADATRDPGRPDDVLPGRPDAAASGGEVLDPAFTSTAAGLSVRPPAGGTMIRRAGGGDEIVRFVSDEQHWTLVVSRVLLSEPVALATGGTGGGSGPDADPRAAGFADTIASQMPSDTPGKLVRSDLLPINGYEGALLASRFTDKNVKKLIQQAVVRRTDRAYYVLTYTTQLTQDEVETDPAAARALEVFAKVVDSLELLDQERITRDQTERLIRTRALMVNWTPKRLAEVLVPSQYLRLQKEGKDVGYTYIVEELASDLPRAGRRREETNADPSGVRIGIRSRTVPESGFVVDAESWLWASYDNDLPDPKSADAGRPRNRKNQEAFRNLIVSTEEGKKSNFAMEVGTSVLRDRIVPVRVDVPGSPVQTIEQTQSDRIELNIWSTSNKSTLPPINREVPPYYLSQALSHLLPRLLPLREPRTYMFASYVPESRQVMTRYVDVLPATTVTLGGERYQAVPVQERIGYEGTVTTHYLSPAGKYLGSVNADNKITILVTDEPTLRGLWTGAKFERPADVDEKSDANDEEFRP